MPTVLCVDDSDSIREIVGRVLTRDGVEVEFATNGAEALDALARRCPDAVVLDVDMPVLGGLDVLRWLADDAELDHPPVMMLTADNQEADVREALALGAADYVVKPFAVQMLRERVRRLLAAAEARPRAGAPSARLGAGVLVVGDPRLLQTARDLLADRFEVVTAASGAAALAATASRHPRVVLIDLAARLPDTPSVAALAASLRAFGAGQLIAIAGSALEDAATLGAFDEALERPLDAMELHVAICRALGASGLHSYLVEEGVLVLRFFAEKVWDQLTGLGGRTFWSRADLAALTADTERALARARAAGLDRLLIDLERVADTQKHEVGAVLSAVRLVAARAAESRMRVAMVVPARVQPRFAPLSQQLGLAPHWRLADALDDLRSAAAGRR